MGSSRTIAQIFQTEKKHQDESGRSERSNRKRKKDQDQPPASRDPLLVTLIDQFTELDE